MDVAGRTGVFAAMSLGFLWNNKRLAVQRKEMYLVWFYSCVMVQCPSPDSTINAQFPQELLRPSLPLFFFLLLCSLKASIYILRRT